LNRIKIKIEYQKLKFPNFILIRKVLESHKIKVPNNHKLTKSKREAAPVVLVCRRPLSVEFRKAAFLL